MADREVWVRCGKAAPFVVSKYHPVEWSCPCHGTTVNGLVRVPGAIEDREAAVEKMTPLLSFAVGRAGGVLFAGEAKAVAGNLLAAALNEEEEG